eukprot:TRINITY_DN1047_c1_g1_i2.p1 TRINITY_DN1047_c1_g1~~TRINITY_DN1047_c1_g1_i2.p1  ORF type:complete len:515 (+),score=101.75 TRINITY_DN1047_c1_g1_i2:192-1736(+)
MTMDAAASFAEKAPKYLAEFVGTFMLVMTVGCTVVTKSWWAVVSIASVLTVMIYALGPISGANFNPAVTLSLSLSQKMEWTTLLPYWASQCLGGLCAGVLFAIMLGDSVEVKPGDGFDIRTAMGAETIYTCMLCFVVLNVAVAGASLPNQYFGAAIGSVIVSGGFAVGGISGACFNPAVTLGLVISALGKGIHLHHGLLWILAELIGAALAAVLFRLVRPEEFGKRTLSPRGGSPSSPLASKAVAEFFGTFMLALTVGLGLVAESPATPLAAAACLMSMIYSVGNISGAHLNPAVSLGILARGGNKVAPMEFGTYITMQVLGGFLGGDFAGLFYKYSGHTHSIRLAPGVHGLASAIVAEVFFTFVLVLVVLAVATVKDANSSQSFGFIIASCVTAGGFASASISGGVLNPAVALSLMSDEFLTNGSLPWANFGWWVGAELVGALLAAGVFFATWRSEYKLDGYTSIDSEQAAAPLKPESEGVAAPLKPESQEAAAPLKPKSQEAAAPLKPESPA